MCDVAACQMCKGTCRGQEEASDDLELELLAVMRASHWCGGRGCWGGPTQVSGRAASALNHLPVCLKCPELLPAFSLHLMLIHSPTALPLGIYSSATEANVWTPLLKVFVEVLHWVCKPHLQPVPSKMFLTNSPTILIFYSSYFILQNFLVCFNRDISIPEEGPALLGSLLCAELLGETLCGKDVSSWDISRHQE